MSPGRGDEWPGYPGERPFPGSGRGVSGAPDRFGLDAPGGRGEPPAGRDEPAGPWREAPAHRDELPARWGEAPARWRESAERWRDPDALRDPSDPAGPGNPREPVALSAIPTWSARADQCPYDLCDGSGFTYDERTNTAYDCRCRPQRVAMAKARSLSAVIPRRYRDVSFDRPPVTDIAPAVVTHTRRFTEAIDDHLDAGRGLWFMGPVGTGKTTLAMLVSKAALRAGRSVAIYSLPRLLNEIRDTHRAERSHIELLDRLTAVDLLHVDDVGAERTTDWVLEELYSIVNARYEDQRSIVLTTNLNVDDLGAQIGERTVSRLTEMCDELPLLGDDHRMDVR